MTDDLRLERVIDAAPDVVFEALTTHAGQAAFYGTDDPGWIVESQCDLRVGGLWTVTFGPSRDHLYQHRSVFEVIDRPRRIVLATTEVRPDRPSFDFSVEFNFEEQGDAHDRDPVRLPHAGASRRARARSAQRVRPARTRHPRGELTPHQIGAVRATRRSREPWVGVRGGELQMSVGERRARCRVAHS